MQYLIYDTAMFFFVTQITYHMTQDIIFSLITDVWIKC